MRNGNGLHNGIRGLATSAALGVALLLMLALAGPAAAATYTPTTFADEAPADRDDCPADTIETDAASDCSLREAIEAANIRSANDVVDLSGGTYTLEDGELFVGELDGPAGTLVVKGDGARTTIIDADADTADGRAVFFSSTAVAELQDLGITGGRLAPSQSSADGGGMAVGDGDGDDAEVTLTRVRLFDNRAPGDGGAIENSGKLKLVQTLVDGNVAVGGSGGGIQNNDELTLTNSTASGNKAQGDGGGIDNDGYAGEAGEPPFARFDNSTIAFNEAGGNGGGVATLVRMQSLSESGSTSGPSARFHSSLVSDNTADGARNCSGNQPSSSEGHNLEDGETCLFAASGDRDAAAGLDPLADNGGGTDTHALQPGSPAIDTADANGCPAVDQRGITRPQRSACDIGAFEREPEPARQLPLPLPSTPEARGPRCLDSLPPRSILNRQGLKVTGSSVTLAGTSRDQGAPCASGVHRVEVSLARVSGTDLNCRFIRRTNRFVLTPFTNCRRPILFIADGTTQWRFKFNARLAPGKYRAQARGYDEDRNKETPKKHRNIVVFTVK